MTAVPGPHALPQDPPENRQDLEAYLGAFTNFERERSLPADRRELGPRRCRILLERRGLLPLPMRVVQVAGSKGKGSTVLWMESLLLGRDVRTAATLSPHLERLEERVRIDGSPVAPATLVATIAQLHPTLREIASESPASCPTFFDLMTATVVEAAVRARAEWLLLEVGLGGPLDSTSAIPHTIGALTTIDLEHREQLGPTRIAIAEEKAKIAREGMPFCVLTDATQDPGASRAALRVARSRGADARSVVEDARVPDSVGGPQRANLSLALACLEQGGAVPFTEGEIESAISRIELPARLEVLPGPPPLLLDGAHTERSIARFVERFREWRGDRPAALLFGSLVDKEWRTALRPLLAEPDVHWIVTEDDSPRALARDELRALVEESGLPVESRPLTEAVARLAELAPRALAVTGSFRLAGAVRRIWMVDSDHRGEPRPRRGPG